MRVSVLGVQYAVEYRTRAQDPELEAADCDGYCDTSIKLCVARKYTAAERKEPGSKKCLDDYMRKCMRHELVHAFLYESGLSINSLSRTGWLYKGRNFMMLGNRQNVCEVRNQW